MSCLSTLIIDPGYTLIIGAFFGLASVGTNRAFWAGLTALLAFGIGIPVFCYTRYPDWMWMYFWDSRAVSLWMVIIAFSFYVPPFLAGYWVSGRLRKRSRAMAWGLFVISLVLEGILLAFLWDRYSRVGTFEQFHAGRAEPLMSSSLGQILNGFFAASVIGMAALWFWARRPARRR